MTEKQDVPAETSAESSAEITKQIEASVEAGQINEKPDVAHPANIESSAEITKQTEAPVAAEQINEKPDVAHPAKAESSVGITKQIEAPVVGEKPVAEAQQQQKDGSDIDVADETGDSRIFALVIEDDPDAAFIYKKAMLDNGYRVEHIAHGGEAQIALKTLNPDVILLDMHLPMINGISLLHQIRSSEHLSQTQVILVTADYGMANSVEADVEMVLLKPVTYSQVKSLVSRLATHSKKDSVAKE